MSHILGLKFRKSGQVYYFNSGPFVVEEGGHVIVNTDQGYGLGQVVLVRDTPPADMAAEELKAIYRLATDEDIEKQKENDELSEEAFQFCRQCILERKLEMKLVDVEVFFDRGKILFYFTAPNRIDFRELVKDLVKNYRTRIELRQIGVRHETQMVGAVGNCGQVCCCRRFLRKFAPVTIRMAKEQNLFLNPTKISGICGRLLCCLNYEQQTYEEFHRQCPKIGKKYATREGTFKVLRANIFRKSLSVLTESNEEREIELDDWHEMDPQRPDKSNQQRKQSDGEKQERTERPDRSARHAKGDRTKRPPRNVKRDRAEQKDDASAASSKPDSRPDTRQAARTDAEGEEKTRKKRSPYQKSRDKQDRRPKQDRSSKKDRGGKKDRNKSERQPKNESETQKGAEGQEKSVFGLSGDKSGAGASGKKSEHSKKDKPPRRGGAPKDAGTRSKGEQGKDGQAERKPSRPKRRRRRKPKEQ